MGHLPPQEYYRTLPRNIAGAGAIFHDASGRILLVKPSYRATWQIPGGAMEEGEYPLRVLADRVHGAVARRLL